MKEELVRQFKECNEPDMKAAILMMNCWNVQDVRELMRYVSLQELIEIEQYLK